MRDGYSARWSRANAAGVVHMRVTRVRRGAAERRRSGTSNRSYNFPDHQCLVGSGARREDNLSVLTRLDALNGGDDLSNVLADFPANRWSGAPRRPPELAEILLMSQILIRSDQHVEVRSCTPYALTCSSCIRYDASKIGKVTTAGLVTEFVLRTSNGISCRTDNECGGRLCASAVVQTGILGFPL